LSDREIRILARASEYDAQGCSPDMALQMAEMDEHQHETNERNEALMAITEDEQKSIGAGACRALALKVARKEGVPLGEAQRRVALRLDAARTGKLPTGNLDRDVPFALRLRHGLSLGDAQLAHQRLKFDGAAKVLARDNKISIDEAKLVLMRAAEPREPTAEDHAATIAATIAGELATSPMAGPARIVICSERLQRQHQIPRERAMVLAAQAVGLTDTVQRPAEPIVVAILDGNEVDLSTDDAPGFLALSAKDRTAHVMAALLRAGVSRAKATQHAETLAESLAKAGAK
jgi:hypothetical protein